MRGASASWTSERGRDLSGRSSSSSHILGAHNLASASASNYKRGLLSFKHSSVDGQSASLTDLCNREQVNKYRISEPFTATAFIITCYVGFLPPFDNLGSIKILSNTTWKKPFITKH